MTSHSFTRSTATIAAWNLAGFGGIPLDRLRHQATGLSLLDAEFVTLVEVPSDEALSFLQDELASIAGLQSYWPALQDRHHG